MRRFFFGIAMTIAAFAPAVGQADDRQIAEFVKNRLQTEQQAGNLKGFNVDMTVEQGTVFMRGFVSNAEQEMLVLRAAQEAGPLGAVQVVDEIEVRESRPMPVSAATQNQMVSMQEPVRNAPAALPQQINRAPVTQASQPMPLPAGPAGYAPQGPAPMPMAVSSGGMSAMGGTPNMPGYAWPGYAAHPNYAAVTYPQQYSPSAWPYIGPFYPYPQVPLGWRRVELQWDDGWWFLDFHDR